MQAGVVDLGYPCRWLLLLFPILHGSLEAGVTNQARSAKYLCITLCFNDLLALCPEGRLPFLEMWLTVEFCYRSCQAKQPPERLEFFSSS